MSESQKISDKKDKALIESIKNDIYKVAVVLDMHKRVVMNPLTIGAYASMGLLAVNALSLASGNDLGFTDALATPSALNLACLGVGSACAYVIHLTEGFKKRTLDHLADKIKFSSLKAAHQNQEVKELLIETDEKMQTAEGKRKQGTFNIAIREAEKIIDKKGLEAIVKEKSFSDTLKGIVGQLDKRGIAINFPSSSGKKMKM